MDIFAGTFSLLEARDIPDLDFDIFQTGEKSYFIMWADESLNTSSQVIWFIEKHFWKIDSYDISIQSEAEIEILNTEFEDGLFESVAFEWPEMSFEDILERFAESDEIITVREAGTSLLYGNKIIKAEFIY